MTSMTVFVVTVPELSLEESFENYRGLRAERTCGGFAWISKSARSPRILRKDVYSIWLRRRLFQDPFRV